MNPRELLIDTFPHIPPSRALEGLGEGDASKRLPNTPHSVVEIVAHLIFWQEWFTARCENVAVPVVTSAARGWPAAASGTWPEVSKRFLDGLARLVRLAETETNVTRPLTPAIEFPPLANYTVADALVHVANHNAHHLGQVIVLRQIMQRWPPPSGGWTW